MFCSNCGESLKKDSRFCCKCGQGVASTSDSSASSNSTVVKELKGKYGTGERYEEMCPNCGFAKEIMSSGVHESESGSVRVYAEDEVFVCPKCPIKDYKENAVQQSSSKLQSKVKSFASYKEFKARQWQSKGKGKEPASEQKVNKATDVAISIGLMEFKEKSESLKPARGKRIVLRVSNMAPYNEVRARAIEKWKAYQSNCYHEGKDYVLLYENGKEAQFLPGSSECFSLKRYQEEIGKEFKRIVLYLCTVDDLKMAEEQELVDQNDEKISDDPEEVLSAGKKTKLSFESDETLAKKLQHQFDFEMQDNDNHCEEELASISQIDEAFLDVSLKPQMDYPDQVNVHQEKQGLLRNLVEESEKKYESCSSLATALAKEIKMEDEFLVVSTMYLEYASYAFSLR